MKTMKKKGKELLAFITVFAILAASIFTGAVVSSTALSCGGTIVEKWDQYENGKYVGWYNPNMSGQGTKESPFIIDTAEKLAQLCRYGCEANVYYKVADEIKAFDMNTVSGTDLTVDNISANDVKNAVADKILGKVWFCDAPFKGNFDGNGVTIYGLCTGMNYYNQASFESGAKAGYNRGGLFGKIDAKTAEIRNITFKNSYFKGDPAGAVFGETMGNGGSAIIENIVVANCYVDSTGGFISGVIAGYCAYDAATSTADKVKLNNCLVYDNVVYNKDGTAARLIGTMEAYCDNGSGGKKRDYDGFAISNTIAIDCNIENAGSYWQKDSTFFTNCYTTGTPANENTTIIKLSSKSDAIGVAASTNLSKLDKSVWFFNTTTYPQLRVFHDIEIQDNGDGTHSEACGCGLEGAPTIHTFLSGVCSGCGFVDPCISGHTLESVEEIPATKTQNGIKAHDYCTVCEKTFIDGSIVLASDLIIPMLVTTSSFTGNLDSDLLGSGTKKDPYLITSADELAAVALGKVQGTSTTYFKVLDSITAFYMNGGETVAKMTKADDVKAYFDANGGHDWNVITQFSGQFDGSGATVYGLYCKTSGIYGQAALFPKVTGHSSIKNISIKNSYISGSSKDGAIAALVGGTIWKGDSNSDTSIAVENIAVVNNYIASTNDSASYSASVLMGCLFDKHYATIDNCIMYGNLVEHAYKGTKLRSGMITTYNGPVASTRFNNIIAIGVTPWTIEDNGDGTYGHAGWYLTHIDAGHFRNIYTDQSFDKMQAYAPSTNSESNLKNWNINILTKEEMQGTAAKSNVTTLDENVWFFNTTTYPQLRVFHELTAESVGVDGHKNEKDECCGLTIIRDGIIPHSYTGNSCSICGYTFPCAYGHNFTDVPAKDASYENAGNIAYKHCSQCDKKYPMDAAIDESVSSAYNDSDVIIPQMLPYDTWDGTFASYFWMNNEGDGSAANPFIIHTAEQLAAVVTASLKYDASKPTSANFDLSKYSFDGSNLDTTNLTFKVRDGLNYFYINGGETVAAMTDANEVKAYFEENGGNNWWIGGTFNGTFNGNGAEIYGVYSSGSAAAGLFPRVDAKASIKNVVLKNSYFVTSEGSHNSISAGGLIGIALWHSDSYLFGTINVRSCTVANNYIVSKNDDVNYGRVGAIAGNLYSNAIVIRDTLVYGNILVNNSAVSENYAPSLVAIASGGNTAFKNIVSIDTVPYTHGGNWHLYDGSKFTNVYTDGAITIADGAPLDYKSITKLTKEQMTGDAAKVNMPNLDWESFWITNDGEYPSPRIINIKDYAAGTAWTGDVAAEFPAGDGTKGNPYLISSAEYLALMLMSKNDGLYYELTADIIFNDTSAEDWTKTAKQWFTSSDVKPFGGYLNGNGHTISGLFYNDIDAGDSAGIIPVKSSGDITNITVKDSYLYSDDDTFVGAVVGSVVDKASAPIVLQGITVEDTVTIDGNAVAGGIVGDAGESVIRISNCISKVNITALGRVGGIVGDGSAGVSVKNCLSINNAPFGAVNNSVVKNVYTNVETNVTGVTVLSNEAMFGSVASTYMSGLDFDNFWIVVDNDYPALNGIIDTSNGVVGEVWSGEIANDYAGGDGSVESPYLIATPEQLARCVTKHAHGKHFKLIADIYLNDVDSAYWDIKVGCNQWFHSKSGASWGLFKNGGSFDGDGHVVYGLYYDRIGFMEPNQGAYLGLFPTVGQKALVQNVAVSHAYIAGSTEYLSDSENSKWFSDSAGGVIGSLVRWDVSYKDELPSTFVAKELTKDPKFWDNMAIVKNCLVDHNSYISATYAGGVLGYCDEPFRAYDLIFTGSLNGLYVEHTGGIAGQDTANGAYYYNCVSLPQTCDRPYGGWANSNWRTNEAQFCTTVTDSYYFSKYRRVNSGEQIANPSDRIGEAAKTAMKLLDWENTWMVIDGGTPIQQIFTKHHTLEEYTALSDKAFLAPYVTVSFFTNTDEVVVDSQVGRMYSAIELPKVSREGYTFTGWYVFDDLSIEYPLDYYPPRDLQLYAGWSIDGIAQNFENYTDTIFDYNGDNWRLNKPGAKGGYKNAYVRNGGKSMRLLDTNTDFSDFLLNYEDMLKIGQTYKMTFWVATDKANNPDTVLKLVHNEYPEYNKSNAGVEEMLVVKGLTVGEWTQYSFEFKARTPWISIRAGANSSLYFDDILISETGVDVGNAELAAYLSKLDPDAGTVVSNYNVDRRTVSPDTSDNITVTILISVILSCAVIVLISKKNLVEIIEK